MLSLQKETSFDWNSLHDLIKDWELDYDNIQGPHLIAPHSGPSKNYLRTHKFNSSTIATHITDIYFINFIYFVNFINKNDTIYNKASLMIRNKC